MNKQTIFMVMVLSLILTGCGDRQNSFSATVVRMQGRYLFLQNDSVVGMVGVHLPHPLEPNYPGPDLYAEAVRLFSDKELRFKIVERRHESGYPDADLVEVYDGDTNLNQELLKRGLAFFNEDHWNAKDKEAYKVLRDAAKSQNMGVWKNQDQLRVLFIRPKNGRFIHFPDCPYVKDLAPADKINYYVPVPRTPFMAVRYAYFCDFCRPRFDRMFGLDEEEVEKEAEKVKLES